MTTDPVFYRLFASSPETFFLMLEMPLDVARQMAARYEYLAQEFKETSYRADGVFRPKEAGLPIYFLEVQFYPLASVYADVLAKAYTYLKQNNPGQTFCAVVLFGTRSLEPRELAPYQPLLDAGLLRRYYLDEIPEVANAPLGLAILYLLRQPETEAPATARDLVARAKSEIQDEALRTDLVELIETVVIYKLPKLTREEIQAMLQVDDLRKTRVYQEGKEEGREEGKIQERKRILHAIAKLASLRTSPAKIAEILQLDVDVVRRALAKKK